MESFLGLLNKYGTAFSAIGAAVAFVWSVIQFFSVRQRDAKAREFETYHKLVKELVEPPQDSGVLYIDRQCAVVFELRFFPRYYPLTLRTLKGLQEKWLVTAAAYPRLLAETDLTIKFLEKRLNSFSHRLQMSLSPTGD